MRYLLSGLAGFVFVFACRAESAPPSWAAEAVFYQIFPERFANGDPHNDPTRDSLELPVSPELAWRISNWTADWYSRDDWEKQRGPDFYKDGVFDRRYGGDLQGVLEKLDYLSDLGINAIYFNPIFYSRSLHKYDGNSYHHIDPFFGPDPQGDLKLIAKENGSDPKTWQWTAADKLFLDLVRQCHERRIRVVIDGVFNHTGRDFFAFQDVRKKQERSRYRNWYVVDGFDNPATKRNEFSYKGWYNIKTLPIFTGSADGSDMATAPKKYIFDATRRWMQPDGKRANGIDGWRLDVAEERPVKFWSDWNGLVRKLNPEAYTTAEIWKPAAELIRQGGFSAAMNYDGFAIPVKGALIDNNVPPSKFAQLLERSRDRLGPATSAVMQNLVDSHDTDRMASMIVNGEGTVYPTDEVVFNKNNDLRYSPDYKIRKPNERERNIQRLIVLLQMCYVGAPMIYYGDEAGMWGAGDPDDRMPMVWPDRDYAPQSIDPRGKQRQPDEVKFDQELFGFYKQAITLRRQHDALNHGDLGVVAADDRQRVIVFKRASDKETLVVALNRGSDEARVALEGGGKSMVPVFVTRGDLDAVKMEISEGGTMLTLPSLTGAVLATE
jgi:cyclomaltodextrinase / maltogenic alpha-amylase / neopullulanase